MSKRILALVIAGLLLFTGCGGEGEGPALAECTDDVPAATDISDLPENFPVPGDVLLTDSTQAGPSLIIDGYFQADLEEAFPVYRDAFEESTYDITKDEQEERDAEVFFAGEGTTGQVNMFAECEGRTKLRITIRPD